MLQLFECLTCKTAGIAEKTEFSVERGRGGQVLLQTPSFSQRKLQQTVQVILVS